MNVGELICASIFVLEQGRGGGDRIWKGLVGHQDWEAQGRPLDFSALQRGMRRPDLSEPGPSSW